MLFVTSLTFGDAISFSYCDKKKYYDTAAVKFPYKKITLKSFKVNGVAASISTIPGDYYFHEIDQLFQGPNQSFDGIGEIIINGQEFVKVIK